MKKTAGGGIKQMADRWSNLVNPRKKPRKTGRKRK